MSNLTKNLKTIMEIRGLNPSSLAKLSGVSQPRIYEILKEITLNPQIRTLEKLAKGLDVDIQILTTGQEITATQGGKIIIKAPSVLSRHSDETIQTIIEILEAMDEAGRKDVLLAVQKEKLLRDMLEKEKQGKA